MAPSSSSSLTSPSAAPHLDTSPSPAYPLIALAESADRPSIPLLSLGGSRRPRAKTLDSSHQPPSPPLQPPPAHTGSKHTAPPATTDASAKYPPSLSGGLPSTRSADAPRSTASRDKTNPEFNLTQIAKQLRLATQFSHRKGGNTSEVKAAEMKALQRKKFLKKTEKESVVLIVTDKPDRTRLMLLLLLVHPLLLGVIWLVCFVGDTEAGLGNSLALLAKAFIDVSTSQIQVNMGIYARLTTAMFAAILSVTGFVLQMSANRFGPHVRNLFFSSKIAVSYAMFVCGACLLCTQTAYPINVEYFTPVYTAMVSYIATALVLLLAYPYFIFIFDFLDPAKIISTTHDQCVRILITAEQQFVVAQTLMDATATATATAPANSISIGAAAPLHSPDSASAQSALADASKRVSVLSSQSSQSGASGASSDPTLRQTSTSTVGHHFSVSAVFRKLNAFRATGRVSTSSRISTGSGGRLRSSIMVKTTHAPGSGGGASSVSSSIPSSEGQPAPLSAPAPQYTLRKPLYSFIPGFSALFSPTRGHFDSSLQADQFDCIRCVDQLCEVARISLTRKERGITHTVVNSFYSILEVYSDCKLRLPKEWSTIPGFTRQSADFLTLTEASIRSLQKTNTWFEYKILKQLLSLFNDCISLQMKDMSAIIATKTRLIAANAAKRGDFAVVDLAIRYLNTYLRQCISKQDVPIGISVSQQFRLLGEFCLAKGYSLFKEEARLKANERSTAHLEGSADYMDAMMRRRLYVRSNSSEKSSFSTRNDSNAESGNSGGTNHARHFSYDAPLANSRREHPPADAAGEIPRRPTRIRFQEPLHAAPASPESASQAQSKPAESDSDEEGSGSEKDYIQMKSVAGRPLAESISLPKSISLNDMSSFHAQASSQRPSETSAARGPPQGARKPIEALPLNTASVFEESTKQKYKYNPFNHGQLTPEHTAHAHSGDDVFFHPGDGHDAGAGVSSKPGSPQGFQQQQQQQQQQGGNVFSFAAKSTPRHASAATKNENLIFELNKRVVSIAKFLNHYSIMGIEKKENAIVEIMFHDIAHLCEAAYFVHSPVHADLLSLVVDPFHSRGWNLEEEADKLPIGVIRARLKLATAYLSMAAIDQAALIQQSLLKEKPETLRRAWHKLQNAVDPDHWEISDVSQNVNYIPEAQRDLLRVFFEEIDWSMTTAAKLQGLDHSTVSKPAFRIDSLNQSAPSSTGDFSTAAAAAGAQTRTLSGTRLGAGAGAGAGAGDENLRHQLSATFLSDMSSAPGASVVTRARNSHEPAHPGHAKHSAANGAGEEDESEV